MGNRNEIGILIAASLPATRNALKMYVSEQPDMHVISEAGDSHELFKKVESTSPNVVLLDWDLLDRATPILIKAMRALNQNHIVIVLSAENDHQSTALDAGADGFVNMGKPPQELLKTIHELFDPNADMGKEAENRTNQ